MTKFDPNSPRGVTTRDGHKVTIDCIYASGEYPIRGRIGDSACQTWWTADGHYYHVGNTTCEWDLINPPEPDPAIGGAFRRRRTEMTQNEEIAALREENARLREALEKIAEYWGKPEPLHGDYKKLTRKWMSECRTLQEMARAALGGENG